MLAKAMEVYDSASNGNRTRGGMKKVSDMYVCPSFLKSWFAALTCFRSIATFRPYFPDGPRIRQASALISATHALSFYSLILQHGVPFKPVSIRVSQDPIALIDKVLEQNASSYTKLDDLIDIGQNLVSAGLPQHQPDAAMQGDPVRSISDTEMAKSRKDAERRVTFMAVQAALREDDFETAYSYIVNRLTPSGVDITVPGAEDSTRNGPTSSSRSRSQPEDDISWRAAFLAGRYRPTTSSPMTLRRLEQRTELLSLALLLAPTSSLTEILAAWRRCEEETTTLQLAQQQAEEAFDDHADKRSALPGDFLIGTEQPELVLNQTRREMGRMGAAGGKGEDEAPMSMFDLTRSAARAFSKNAFPLRGAAAAEGPGSVAGEGEMDASVESLERVRKRDMVANAVSGGLASGLGWVLGATPVERQQQ